MSINQQTGFSITTYSIPSSTANNHFTISHGLNKTPEVIIVKNTVQPGHSGSQMWCVYHHSEPTKTGFLNRTLAFTTQENTNNFNGTVPTSQVFTVGHPSNNNSGDTCRDGNSYVAYAWHSVPGYSAFGNYIPNNNANGPFVYTGFLPSLVITKRADGGGNWVIEDNARNPYNPVNDVIYANSSTGNGTTTNTIDFLSKILNHKKDNNRVQFSVENSEFSLLQKSEKKFGMKTHKGKDKFFRSGKAEQWKDILSLAQIKKKLDCFC